MGNEARKLFGCCRQPPYEPVAVAALWKATKYFKSSLEKNGGISMLARVHQRSIGLASAPAGYA